MVFRSLRLSNMQHICEHPSPDPENSVYYIMDTFAIYKQIHSDDANKVRPANYHNMHYINRFIKK